MPLSDSLFAKIGAHVGNDFDCPEDPRAVAEAFESSQALNDAARNLAANLLRVIAGAGKKHALIDEATALLKACRELQPYSGTDAYSYSPIAAIAEGLTDLDWRKNNPAEDFRRGIAGDAKFRPTIAELSRLTRMRALRFAEEAAQIGRVLTAKTRKRIDPAERARVAAGLDPSAAQLGASMAADLDAALQAHAPKPR